MAEGISLQKGKTEEGFKQKVLLEELRSKAIGKLSEAIEMNKVNNRSEDSRRAKAEACALLLVAIRAGVQFDPNDPVFQIFVQKRSWQDAMERACKEVCNPSTAVARHVMEAIKLLPSFNVMPGVDLNLGNFVENFLGLFKKNGVKPQDEAEVYNKDLWHDFSDEIPKRNEKKLSVSRDLKQLEENSLEENAPSGLQKCLSERVVEDVPLANKYKNSVPRRAQKNEVSQQLKVLSKRQNLNSVA